jgi:hypothetical protein
MSSKTLLVCVAVFAAVAAFVVFGTHFITQLIDRKIGDIRVNVPRIRINQPSQAPPPIVFKISEDNKGRVVIGPQREEAGQGNKGVKPRRRSQSLSHPNKIQLYEPFLAVRFDDEMQPDVDDVNEEKEDPFNGPIVVDTNEPPTNPRILVGCRTDADCNVVNGDGKNVCKADGTCSCVGGGSGLFCHYGPTAYRDPKDMTPDELRRFKAKYRNNYTLQDYKNWLMLYKRDPENLRAQHRKNLRVLLQGGQLTPKDVPHIRIRPPTDAADYFQRMYKGGNIAVHFPDNDSPYVGANYGDYGDFVPPENVASSWITGVVNAYKEDKDDARALQWYLRPEITTGEDEQRVGDIYNRYVEKHHNLADVRAYYQRLNSKSLKTFEAGDPNVDVVN